MNDRLCDKLKLQLEQKEVELQTGLEDQLAQLTCFEEAVPVDSATRAEALEFRRVAMQLGARKRRHLIQIQNALGAISNGTYGTCHKCGVAISEERLEIQPETLLCFACAKKIAETEA